MYTVEEITGVSSFNWNTRMFGPTKTGKIFFEDRDLDRVREVFIETFLQTRGNAAIFKNGLNSPRDEDIALDRAATKAGVTTIIPWDEWRP